MIELDFSKKPELIFQLNIEGNKSVPKANLVIKIDEKKSLKIEGFVVNDQVKISPDTSLKEIINKEQYKAFLEVIVDNNYFVPWEDTISIHYPIKITAESQYIESDKISVKSKEVIIENKEENNLSPDSPASEFIKNLK